MSTASKVAERKKLQPDLYCPKPGCLWCTGGGYCPRHFKDTLTTKSNPNPVFQDFIDGWAAKNHKARLAFGAEEFKRRERRGENPVR